MSRDDAGKSSPRPTHSAPKWAEEVLGVAWTRFAEIEALTGLTLKAIGEMQHLKDVAEVLRVPAPQADSMGRAAALAREEVGGEFWRVYGQAVVSLWTTIEVCAHDLARAYVVNDPTVRSLEQITRVKVSIAEFESMDALERADHILRQLETTSGASKKPGVGRFTAFLDLIPLNLVLDDVTRRDLVELGAVRNLIAHRAGVVDRRFLRDCPWIALGIGDTLRVGHSMFSRYVRAKNALVVALIAAIKLRHPANPISAA